MTVTLSQDDYNTILTALYKELTRAEAEEDAEAGAYLEQAISAIKGAKCF